MDKKSKIIIIILSILLFISICLITLKYLQKITCPVINCEQSSGKFENTRLQQNLEKLYTNKTQEFSYGGFTDLSPIGSITPKAFFSIIFTKVETKETFEENTTIYSGSCKFCNLGNPEIGAISTYKGTCPVNYKIIIKEGYYIKFLYVYDSCSETVQKYLGKLNTLEYEPNKDYFVANIRTVMQSVMSVNIPAMTIQINLTNPVNYSSFFKASDCKSCTKCK